MRLFWKKDIINTPTTLNYKWFSHTEHENGVVTPVYAPEVISGHEWCLNSFSQIIFIEAC